ncbi:MAG: tetratricopeptide repeat protein [Flavobacteriales bacterium]
MSHHPPAFDHRVLRTLYAVLLLFVFGGASGQGAKAFIKEAEGFAKEGNLNEAIARYTLAVQVDPKNLKALNGRADLYERTGKSTEAANDLKAIVELDSSDPEHANRAAWALYNLKRCEEAKSMCDKALATDPDHLMALQCRTRTCLALKDLDCATASADAALKAKRTTDTHYLHGLVALERRDYSKAAEDFQQVIDWNYLYEQAYVGFAETQLKMYEEYTATTMQMRTLDLAVAKTTTALELNPRSTDALFTRSKALALQKEFGRAIDDISKCMAMGREDATVYAYRARYYHGHGQHQNAVNDLNKALLITPNDVELLLLRSECKESNLDLDGAVKDLDLARKAMDADTTYGPERRREIETRRARIAKQAFEMNRESDPPVVNVLEPYRTGDAVQVSSALKNVKVSGYVRDKSLLDRILVNGTAADFNHDEKDPEFITSVPLAANAGAINVLVMDVYGNTDSVVLKVQRSEGVPPTIELTRPIAGTDAIITIDANKEDIFVEGRASDQSDLRSITVDGVFASFIPDTTSSEFSIKLPVVGKDHFTVRAEDQHGNIAERTYALRRRAEPIAVVEKPAPVRTGEKPAEKPVEKPVNSNTGVTWVVMIENSDYKSFPALQGPADDVAKMQKAFGKYSVQRTINKRNMTKQQIERFFNIELRDLVRTNKVNTVLVWYAGHGRTVSGRTYWVPTDARKDDIYTFYNYGPLKGLIENYSESVTNTLVVSDAAGADPSFYEMTR